MEDINPDNPAEALGSHITETSKVIGWLNQVIASCMITAITSYLGENLESLGATEIELNGAPDWKAITIPYFVEIAEAEVT